jgi:adenine phosphoribosyltransferase
MVERLRKAIRDVEGFPKEGIIFKDITPILGDAELFRASIDLLSALAGEVKVDKIIGVDARGFIFAAAVADRLGVGFVPVRKKGKLPWKCKEASYALEYGEATVEMHVDAVQPGEKVMLVDDLLATGGTSAAAVKLLTEQGAEIVAISFLIELSFLHGREKLAPHPVKSILKY